MHVQEIFTPDERKRYLVLDEQGDIVLPIARYLKYLDNIGRARNTLRSYAHSLRLYFEYLEQKGLDYPKVTLDDMAGFVLWLKNPYRSTDLLPKTTTTQARSNGTVNQALTAVSGFYDYLWRQEDLDTDINQKTRTFLPARSRTFKSFLHHIAKGKLVEANVLKQKTPKRKPKTLTKEQIETLVAACNNRRDRLLLTLLYESSVRIGEALALWIEDVNIARCKLHIHDRGELENDAEIKTVTCERSVDVSRELVNHIMGYLAIAHDDEVETNHLFIKLSGPNRGKPMTYGDVNDLFVRLKQKTSIDASAHLLRHSSLTALAQAGWRPEHLRERAGHAQFQTTYSMYVHPSDEDLRQDWERTQAQMQLNRTAQEGLSE